MIEDDLTDNDLISGYLEGNESYLGILIQRYLKLIYNFILAHIHNTEVADDLTQEVFVKVWEHLVLFDQKQSFKAWLFKITRNTIVDWLRQQKRHQTVSLEESDQLDKALMALDNFKFLPDDVLGRLETAEQLELALDQLPDKYREVLKDYATGQNLKEIAELRHLPMNTLKSRYRRAILLLRRWWTM